MTSSSSRSSLGVSTAVGVETSVRGVGAIVDGGETIWLILRLVKGRDERLKEDRRRVGGGRVGVSPKEGEDGRDGVDWVPPMVKVGGDSCGKGQSCISRIPII